LKIFHSIEEYRASELSRGEAGSAVTLGKFDGIHIGHQKLIRDIVSRAGASGLTSIVFAIEMKDGAILSHEERAEYLESMGVDVLLECPFSESLMKMRAPEFARTVLFGALHAVYAAVGPDFAFGHHREGNAEGLAELGAAAGCQTRILEKERFDGADVSSTRVREALRKADMELAAKLLGRPYPITGIVRHGRHIGTGIGFPTVNILPEEGKILPPDGVYASVTMLPGKIVRKGLTNVGIRPTVGGRERRAETTLFDFDSDLYGERISHALTRFIRPEKKFASLEALKEQIGKDAEAARG